MRRVVFAAMLGNSLEWYDFALYGYFAPIFGKIFFPLANESVQLIATYGIFAAGFVTRPFGAVLFGYLGDRFGRKAALTLSMMMMALPTTFIGLIPTYETIGIFAPFLLFIVRLIQGLAVAGQYSGSITFTVEHAPMNKRGLVGSTTILSLCIGMLLGSFVAAGFFHFFSKEALESWAWRIPFLFGIGVAFVGHYIRKNTEESPHYAKAKETGHLSRTPLKEIIHHYPYVILRGVGIYMTVTVPFYILTVFMNNFVTKTLGTVTINQSLLMNSMCVILLMILIPINGWMSDRLGRKRVLVTSCILFLIFTYPVFVLITSPDLCSVILGELALTVLVGSYIGAVPSLLVELFPTSIRYTGMALSYNICAAFFGGTAPSFANWLIQETGLNTSVAFYIIFCAFCSLIAFYGYHDRYKEELL